MLLIKAIFNLGFLYLVPLTDAIYLYTPTDALSKIERQTIHDLWPLTEDNYVPGRAVTQSREAQITVVARDGGNILLPEYARAIKRLDMYIQNRIKICSHYRSGYLGAGLGGVSLSRGDNDTVILASARAWLLIYQLKFYPTNVSYISGVWEKIEFNLVANVYLFPLSYSYFRFITAFLILVSAVGTDNMFLMVASVKRTSRALPVSERIGECMADAAVSILITALTDAFSFGVGTITTIPAVQIFCIYTCCALVLTFLYQITFFCALLSLATRSEAEGLHCLLFKSTIPPKMHSSSSITSKLMWMGSRAHPDPTHTSNNKHCLATNFFQNWYAPILMQPVIKVLAGIWYCIYVSFAIYGCLQLREGLEPVNLLQLVIYYIWRLQSYYECNF
uniref:SSD domain-containing protein n=1 Tax=Heterorhabditis bacteriophora TaxID=37862 RepID=A0A1I7XNK4_HETBA